MIKELLSRNDLPVADVSFSKMHLYVVRHEKKVIACGAFEIISDCALLRSLAVEEGFRGKGLGKKMIAHLIREALTLSSRNIFLLTETAVSFFSNQGFEPVNRESVPLCIANTEEFTELCPSTAIIMKLRT